MFGVETKRFCGGFFGGFFGDAWAGFCRSWTHSTAMQLATLATLAAAYSVIAFGLVLSLNLRQVLARWGESVQISAYLSETADGATSTASGSTTGAATGSVTGAGTGTPSDPTNDLAADPTASPATVQTRIADELASLSEVGEIEFIPKEKATELFRAQMANYAPDLLGDKDFASPFPASFRVKIKAGTAPARDAAALERLAARIRKIAGIEDVSYGQNWVRNYAGLVRAVEATGWALALVIAAGGLFTIGNSVRASIGSRREEIEILELVGATAGMIRAPYVVEGAAMGFCAAGVAVAANFAIWLFEDHLLRQSFSLSRLADGLAFLPIAWIAGILFIAAALGAIGAFATVRSINDGWAASQVSRA